MTIHHIALFCLSLLSWKNHKNFHDSHYYFFIIITALNNQLVTNNTDNVPRAFFFSSLFFFREIKNVNNSIVDDVLEPRGGGSVT